MTRTNKWTVHEHKAQSHYFTHNGVFGTAPNAVKKTGAGRGNWGRAGDELQDLIEAGEVPPIFHKHRRGSNNQGHADKFQQMQNLH